MALLQLHQVDLAFGNRPILKGGDLKLEKGEMAYLVGPTGVGKSSLLKLIYADLKPDAGGIFLGDFQVHQLTRNEVPFLRRRVGVVFQDYQLLPDRTIFQNLQIALKATGWKKNLRIKQRINEVLLLVGLTGRANIRPLQLSGGEQQRAAIARALLNDPLLLIADEPTGNLDPEASFHVMQILRKINFGGTAVLMTTHEYSLIRHFPARVIELKDGTLTSYPEAGAFLTAYSSRFVQR